MIKTDYHTHSNYSFDGKASMDAMIEQAIKLGLEEYAITDHIDFGYPHPKIIGPYDISDIVIAMGAVKAEYAGRIRVLAGMEISLRPDLADVAQQMVNAHDFDFVIGSLHDIMGIDLFWPEFYRDRSRDEAYALYYENLLDMVRICDAYDVLGHFDYIKRLGKVVYNDMTDFDNSEIVDDILKTVISKGKGIEINTAGIAYGIGHPHPHIDILRRYFQLGGEIVTVGSDAHAPKNIAQHFSEAYEILRQLGIRYITRFERRKPIFQKIY
jgi:histidinol-phosphatase (PHP family)